MRSGPPQQLIEKNRDPMPVPYSEPRAQAREPKADRPVNQFASLMNMDDPNSFLDDGKSFRTQGPPHQYKKVNHQR
jgi:hypothetical protein